MLQSVCVFQIKEKKDKRIGNWLWGHAGGSDILWTIQSLLWF